jgi:DNA-directed RNA polymerase subunit H (RpoH/RPB5)
MNEYDLLPDESLLPILDLDEELYERNNISIAFLVVISGLIKNENQRQEILERVRIEYMGVPKVRYLYAVAATEIKRNGSVDVKILLDSIPDFEPIVYGDKSTENSRKSEYYTLAQILYFQPTADQVSKAIDMIVKDAIKRGVAS